MGLVKIMEVKATQKAPQPPKGEQIQKSPSILGRGWVYLLFLFFFNAEIQAQEMPKINALKFNFFWGNETFQLEKPLLLGKDTVYFSKMQFYISNIAFQNQKNNSKIPLKTNVKNFPTLISLENNTLPFSKNISLKNNTYLMFALGLDEPTNTGKYEQKHDLDPQNGMFWTWESGYIFWKLEGYFFKNNQKKGLIFHLGRKNCYQEIILDTKNTKIEKTAKENISMNALVLHLDMQQLWDNQSLSSLPQNMMIGIETEHLAKKIAKLFVFK